MPKFSQESLDKLQTCHIDLQRVFSEVIKAFDCTVLCGFRSQAEQDAAFTAGLSKKKWPTGEHNKIPSRAIDVAPYPVDWKDPNRMRYFAGYVVGTARMMGIKIRWGDDWDMDTDLKDTTFHDLPHFEVVL